MADKNILGKNISRLRKEKKIRQAEMAKTLNMSTSTLSLYENGKASPKEATLREIAALLDVEVGKLYAGQEEGEAQKKGDGVETVAVGTDDIVAYARILDRASAHCPQNGEAGRALSEALEASEAMLKALGTQSRAMEHLRAQLDYATKLLTNRD